jgi:hypothetical protein
MPLRFDQLLLDILDWIRKALQFRRGEQPRPYEVLHVYPGQRGVLRVLSRPTNRAVSTLEFQPHRKVGEDLPNRIHLYCDHLDKIPGDPTPRVRGASHRIQVLSVSPVLTTEGYAVCEVLFRRDYQLQCDSYRDRFAKPIMLSVGLQLLRLPTEGINWDWEIEATAKQVMGAHYTL